MLSLKDFPLDHIGLAVHNLDEATARFQNLGPVTLLGHDLVPSQKVEVRFLKVGDTKIELLKATDEGSPISRFIGKRGPGIHHLAFGVKDIFAEIVRLRKEGFHILQEEPIRGAMGKWVFFIHPKSMGGTLVEICQPIQNE
ncbi:UNVERIFIED_CONTAM: hypothetical protein GTU68_045526 [Idotea baltica]|nr:hypothetical protein [Idotea baltica]